MAAAQCKKACGLDMARVIVEIWPYTSQTTKETFCTNILRVEGLLTPDATLQTEIQANAHILTFNQMLTLIDTSIANWQISIANVTDLARASSNAERLNRLTELTLKSIESRPVTCPPPIFQVATHFNYANFIRTSFTYWADSQGLTKKTASKHLPMTFSNLILRDQIHEMVRQNEGDEVDSIVRKIVQETALESESEYATRQRYNSFKFASSKSLADNMLELHLLRRAGWTTENENSRLAVFKEKFLRNLDVINNPYHL